MVKYKCLQRVIDKTFASVISCKRYFIIVINGCSICCNYMNFTASITCKILWCSRFLACITIGEVFAFNALGQTFYRSVRVGLVSFQRLLDRLFPYASIASYGRIKSPLGIFVFFNPTTCWTEISLHCAENFCIKNFLRL